MLSISTFGGLDIRTRSGDKLVVGGRKPRALFAYLALASQREFGRSHLAGLLWPDCSEDAARHSLRQSLTALRQSLGSSHEIVHAGAGTVQLNAAAIDVDAQRLMRFRDGAGATEWQRGLDLYHGELLGDFDVDGTPFSDWLRAERQRMRECVAHLLSRMVTSHTVAGDLSAAIGTTRRIIALDPYDEVERRRIIKLFLRQGQPAAAVREYLDLRSLLRRDFEVEPSVETRRLYGYALEASERDEAPSGSDVAMLHTYAQALEQLPDSVIVADLDSRIVGWSDGAAREFGFTKAEALGQTPEILHGDTRKSDVPYLLLRSVLETGSWSGSVRIVCGDGKRVTVRRSVAPLRLPSGRLIGTFGTTAIPRLR